MLELSPPSLNLRHLQAFAAVGRAGSIARAKADVHLSQPAITQAIAKLERQVGVPLFLRDGRGMAPTPSGGALLFRVTRGLDQLRNGVQGLGRRLGAADVQALTRRITAVQLRALLAIEEHRSYSAAARALAIAQPSVFRAARGLEAVTRRDLFVKSADGIGLTSPAVGLARAVRLMWAEIFQGLQEVTAETDGREGLIRVGSLPLARSAILPGAIERSLVPGAGQTIHVVDGPYAELLQGLLRGDLDVIVGALRTPAPSDAVTQERLFDDRVGVFCGPDHPLRGKAAIEARDLAPFPWVLARSGTPSRAVFDTTFAAIASARDFSPIETSSMILVRGLLQSGRRLTMMSKHQVAGEVATGTMAELSIRLADPPRPIGITVRKGWLPTRWQSAFLQALKAEAAVLCD